MADPYRAYRPWFYAATVYNLTWGVSVLVHPRWYLWLAGMDDTAAPFAQGIAMMVAVYAYGYYLLAQDPERYAPFIWIALAGKAFGIVGYVVCVAAGTLPWRFGLNALANDLIWFPAFLSFGLRHARGSTKMPW